MTYAFLTIALQYEILNLTAGYLMPNLGFPIFPSGKAEDQGWEFILNKQAPRVVTANGGIIPLMRDDTTGFHWIAERPNAAPALRMKKETLARLVEREFTFSRKPDEILLEMAEEKPTAIDNFQATTNELGGQSTLRQNMLAEFMHLGQIGRCLANECKNPQRGTMKYCSDRCQRATQRGSRTTLEGIDGKPVMRPRQQQ